MVTHDVALRALGATELSAPLTLVERSDEDFISGVLSQLGTIEGRDDLATQRPQKSGEFIELFQPVHRTFYLALADTFCAEIGEPRLDPRRIESSGLVVRRVYTPTGPGKRPKRRLAEEAWIAGPDGSRGWRRLDATTRDRDPDPRRRKNPSVGHALIDAQLARFRLPADGEEQVTTLFVTAPDTGRATGKTTVYGLVPTASQETSAAPEMTFTRQDVLDVLPDLLKPGSHGWPSDLSGATLTKLDSERLERRPIYTLLSVLTVAVGLFRDDGVAPPGGDKVVAALDRLTIAGLSGAEFMRRAADIVVFRRAGSITMPTAWPQVPEDVSNQIVDAVAETFRGRAAALAPPEGRFEVANARYVARAFVRVRRDDGCPPVLVWSARSEPFLIAPWHKNGPRPPVRVVLPDLVPDKLKAIKPNVSFVVPDKLAGFLQALDPKGLLKGKGSAGSPTLGWICGFNIPIITLCAFIVLFIFLALLHIIFWWLPFVRICIPIPSSLKSRFFGQ
jgi:hypothetical protein